MSRMGSEISRLRKEVGMTQKQLAKAIGVTEGFIVEIESGRRVVKDDLIKKISKALRQEVGKLDLFENGYNNEIPEPDKNVKKVVEKPVQDIWNDALAGVLMNIPVYTYRMDKAIDSKQLPIVSNKVEGFPKDKVFYLNIEDSEMAGFRIFKGDNALAYRTQEIDKDGIFLIEYNSKRMIRQVKSLEGGKLLLVSNKRSLVTDTAYKKDVKVLGRLIRLEIIL